MEEQTIKKDNTEEVLWETSKKYIKGEINAEELKNSLVSHSVQVREFTIMRYFLISLTVIFIIAGLIVYAITKDLVVLSTTAIAIASPILLIIRYYFQKMK